MQKSRAQALPWMLREDGDHGVIMMLLKCIAIDIKKS